MDMACLQSALRALGRTARTVGATAVFGGMCACSWGHHAGSHVEGSWASIPAASYWMGTDSSEVPALLRRYHTTHADLLPGETPRRLVHLQAFEMQRTEVTNESFAGFLSRHPDWRSDAVPPESHNGQYLRAWIGAQYPAGTGKYPVTFVTWSAAFAYC